jgi:hypothetical protein
LKSPEEKHIDTSKKAIRTNRDLTISISRNISSGIRRLSKSASAERLRVNVFVFMSFARLAMALNFFWRPAAKGDDYNGPPYNKAPTEEAQLSPRLRARRRIREHPAAVFPAHFASQYPNTTPRARGRVQAGPAQHTMLSLFHRSTRNLLSTKVSTRSLTSMMALPSSRTSNIKHIGEKDLISLEGKAVCNIRLCEI